MIPWILFAYAVVAVIAVLMFSPRLFGFRFGFRKLARKQATEKRKMSIVIPARDESSVIGDLFGSIARQDYDKSFFEVNVIVKDPDDPTVKMAEAIGANVYVAPDQTCKGEALNVYFRAAIQDKVRSDAYIIVDADAVLAPSFLTEFNNALEYEGHDIFVARKCAKNFLGGKRKRSLFSNCSALTYPIVDDLGNRYRMHKDIPINICGQGLMVRSRVIKTLGGWPYTTITEDYELKLDSLLRGFRSMLYPYAVIYTEEALGHKENTIRRTRWLTGYKQCDKLYKKRIIRQARERGKLNGGEREYFFGVVPILLFAADTFLTVLAGAGVTIWYVAMRDILWRKALKLLVLLPLVVMYAMLFFYGALASISWKDVDKKPSAFEWACMLLYNPFYLIEYVPIYLKGCFYCMSNKTPEWKQTERINYESVDIPADEGKNVSDAR